MPLLLILAALAVIHGALGQTPSTNLTFFQRFIAGEIPVREIVWKTRNLPPPTNGPAGFWAPNRAGWVTHSSFAEEVPIPEIGYNDGMFMGASRRQYWSVTPSGVQTVDRDKSEPSTFGARSEPWGSGALGVHTAMFIRSLGLALIETGTVRWHSDGSFDATVLDFVGRRLQAVPLSGRILRQSEAGPLEIEFRSRSTDHPQRVSYRYGTNLGVALPEQIVRFEGKDLAIPTSEIVIERVNLDVSDLSPDGFTPWMFSRPGWSTNLITWTNSTRYVGGTTRGTTYYRQSVARAIHRLRSVLQRLGIRTRLDTLDLGPIAVR